MLLKQKLLDVEVSGPLLQEMLQSGIGDAIIFSVGARIAVAAASKHALGLSSKISISLASGTARTA